SSLRLARSDGRFPQSARAAMNNAGSRTGSNRSRANGRLDLLDFELLKRRMYLTELTYWLGKIFENQEVD
ncbi:MAG: hypothetical protein WBO74_06260, partial [Thermoanaerobaculia bacterium]